MTTKMVKVAAERQPREGSVSFESRIAGVALITAVAVLIAASLAFILEQWRAEKQLYTRIDAGVAQMLAAEASDSLMALPGEKPRPVLQHLGKAPRVASADLYDAQGRLVESYRRAGEAADQVNVRREPVIAGGAKRGELVIRTDHFKLSGILPRYLAVGGALFFVAAGIALFMGRWLAARVTEPVARLSEAMEGITDGHAAYDRRVEPMYDDEVGRLTTAFNELLGRLQTNDQALRQTMDDLTEARDAAEAANVLKSHFLANMSHEIRTPLNGVLAMAQIMGMGELEPSQRERLDVIRNSGEALLAVLNDILDLSKIEAGRMELDEAPFDAAATLGQTFAAFTGMAEKKGLEYGLEIEPAAEGWRQGDSARVCQIASNLISNAIKFTEKGRVLVKVQACKTRSGEGLRLIVSDTGMGIAKDKQSYLFEKFSQVDGSSTRKFGGTGLGLAICRELAQLMGGVVKVESVVGKGSTFIVELPLALAAKLPSADSPPAASLPSQVEEMDGEERPLRVLAAEDNPTNQLVLRTVMQTFGADLELVGDGKQAVEAWSRGEFDIILMDIQMPEMDGLTATRKIRDVEAITGRPRTPVIAVSANAMTHQVKEYLAAGMDGHVAKPIELLKLHAAMGEALAASPLRAAEAAPESLALQA